MTVLVDLFWFIVTFSILVVLHEGGHFLAARAFGVHVHEFMIGLPGPALRFRGKKTDYGVTAIPLGGYVRISGMDPGPEDPRLGTVLAYVTRRQSADTHEVALDLSLSLQDADALLATLVDWNAIKRATGQEDAYAAVHPAQAADDPDTLLERARASTYRGLPAYKRILVLVAGVFVNLVAALLVFVLVLTLVGPAVETTTIEYLVPNGGAEAAGIEVGETVTAIDGESIPDWDTLFATIAAHKPGDKIFVTVAKGSSTRVVPVTLGSDGHGHAKVGIQGSFVNQRQSLPQAVKMSVGFVGQVFVAIAGFFNPHTFQQSVQGSTGVIGIAILASQQAAQGPIDFAFFIAALSLSLGAMNILPIPPLDGGKIVLEIVEVVRRRPLSRKFSIGVSLAGTLVFVALIGYLMYADVIRFVIQGS